MDAGDANGEESVDARNSMAVKQNKTENGPPNWGKMPEQHPSASSWKPPDSNEQRYKSRGQQIINVTEILELKITHMGIGIITPRVGYEITCIISRHRKWKRKCLSTTPKSNSAQADRRRSSN